jgi:hypothetical protein
VRERPFAVIGDESGVDAWSTARLPSEPKGWLLELRNELRRSLRAMRATTSNVLYGEYAAPEPAFVDLENVLLYNVGSGCYSHLTTKGLFAGAL